MKAITAMDIEIAMARIRKRNFREKGFVAYVRDQDRRS